jgi:hypothetical protein
MNRAHPIRRDLGEDPPEPTLAEKATMEAQTRQLQRMSFAPVDYSGVPVAGVIQRTAKIYADALADYLRTLDYDRAEASRRAAALWRGVLPELVDRQSTVAYVACVSWGLRMNLLTPTEAKTMMFIAQNQLTVLKMLGTEPPKLPIESAPLFAAGQVQPRRAKDVG